MKEIVEKEGRPNLFKNNVPGRKWWSLFLKRHPNIFLRTPEHLPLSRVQACTSEGLDEWYHEFDQFLQMHDLKDLPHLIWNADESGFQLCPKTGKVLAIRNAWAVYGITQDSKELITTLCAANVAGDVIPPMHIFSGVRFKSNPLEGSVDNAYMGRSPNGWISTELFYGWLANHFAKWVKHRPVVLLVDGHSSHIDLEVSKFCRDNNIHLYCLPAHTSHLTQPLDVGFFKALKTSWGKACEKYKMKHPSIPLTKYGFAKVFRDAWLDFVKMSTFVNAFKQAGICPLNRNIIDESKVMPSNHFFSQQSSGQCEPSSISVTSSAESQSSQVEALKAMESVMKQETVQLYKDRFAEGYDLEIDEMYCVWAKLKALMLADAGCGKEKENSQSEHASNAASSSSVLPVRQQKVSSVLDEILTYPEPEQKKKSEKPNRSQLPKHLSGEQYIAHIQQKKDDKKREEDEKKERKQNRERKKVEKEAQKSLHGSKKLQKNRHDKLIEVVVDVVAEAVVDVVVEAEAEAGAGAVVADEATHKPRSHHLLQSLHIVTLTSLNLKVTQKPSTYVQSVGNQKWKAMSGLNA